MLPLSLQIYWFCQWLYLDISIIPNSVFVWCCFQTHMSSPDAELSQAALQALGFCVYHSRVVSGVPGRKSFKYSCSLFTWPDGRKFSLSAVFFVCFAETFALEILSALCSLIIKSTDKNTCTRALWVISKQSFPQDMVAKKVSFSRRFSAG